MSTTTATYSPAGGGGDDDYLWEIARQMADAAHDRPGSHPDTYTGVRRRKKRWRLFRSVLDPQRQAFDRETWSTWLVDNGWVEIADKDVVTRRCWRLQNRLVNSGFVEGVGRAAKEPAPLSGWMDADVQRLNRQTFRLSRSMYRAARYWKDGSPFQGISQPIFTISDDEQILYSRRVREDSFRSLHPTSAKMGAMQLERYPIILQGPVQQERQPPRRGGNDKGSPDRGRMLHFVMQGETTKSRAFYQKRRGGKLHQQMVTRYGSSAHVAVSAGLHRHRQSVIAGARIGQHDLKDLKHHDLKDLKLDERQRHSM